MGHFQLRADESSTMAEQLELSGSKSFYVSPNSKNETQAQIRGSAIVSILGKNYSIQLTHKTKDYVDPEPSTTKWSYIENLYISGTTPVPSTDAKVQDTGYIRASRGKTVYSGIPNIKESKIIISNAYTTYQAVLDRVGDFSKQGVGTSYDKGATMTLFTFTMYYKYSTESEGKVIPPVDDGTPASNKARIPCRPDASAAPDWVSNLTLLYQVNFDISGISGFRKFSTWDDFIAFWDSIQTDPKYTDAVFHYILQGTVAFNELLTSRGGSGPITITEIDNGKGVGIHGAKPLYLIISQQEGKTIYGASIIQVGGPMQDNEGRWNFDDPSEYTLYINKASDKDNPGTYNLIPEFRIDSSLEGHAYSLSLMTNTHISPNQESGGTVDYQYIGRPFILKLFKETANGIEGRCMRPYYKQLSTVGSTEFWRDSNLILGFQNFNPIQYDNWDGNFNYAHLRECGYRGFLSGPLTGDYGLCIFQLVPLCLYKQNQEQFTFTDGRLTDYTYRYYGYRSAIGENDRYQAAFLKWPNPDGNNDPSHIDTQGNTESIPSQMGKMWESNVQNNSDFKFISRVMFIPVLWTNKALEDNEGLRDALINGSLGFGHYMLSPDITDSEIDADPTAIYRIYINGLDIQMR